MNLYEIVIYKKWRKLKETFELELETITSNQ